MENIETSEVVLSTVLLNWNRLELLRTAVESYLKTVSVPYELILMDNASSDGSREFIDSVCRGKDNHRAILLDDNIGGEALNVGLSEARGVFLHISENDVEYLPGWDANLLQKFRDFPELGQLSVFSPFHQVEDGEIWCDKPALRRRNGSSTIYVALDNISPSSLVKRELWDMGVRWRSLSSGKLNFPADGPFSAEVKSHGYVVAWNDRYVVKNWGHNIAEVSRRLRYYFENAEGKHWFGIEGLMARIREHGYDIRKNENGAPIVVQVTAPNQSVAYKKSEEWKEWMAQLVLAREEILPLLPLDASVIWVDDNVFGEEALPERRVLPFLEHQGQAWGAPADDATAIQELKRMRAQGADFIVFVWPAYWWLDYYSDFSAYIRGTFRCTLENERLVVFDVRLAK